MKEVLIIEIIQAVKKPFTDFKNLIIGIILNILPIVNFISLGYALECSGIGDNKASKTLPEWKNWGELFVKGFFAFLISLLYGIPVIILTILFFGQTILTSIKTGAFKTISGQGLNIQMFTANQGLVTGGIIILLAVVLVNYLLPAAILTYLKHRRFKEAFNFQKIYKKIINKKYLIIWLITTIIWFIIIWITGLFSAIPVLFEIIVSAGVFINYIIMYTLFGDVYNKIK